MNGIAVAVIELKRTSVDMAEDMPQLITNQEAKVKNALFTLLHQDRDATQRLFALLQNQPGYH